jgi:hypothetical protein
MNPVSANLSGTLLDLETRHINFSSDRSTHTENHRKLR